MGAGRWVGEPANLSRGDQQLISATGTVVAARRVRYPSAHFAGRDRGKGRWLTVTGGPRMGEVTPIWRTGGPVAAESATGLRSDSTRWLVTGACGRLGSHVLAELNRRGATCLGVSRHELHGDHGPLIHLNLEDEQGLAAVLQAMDPTHIIHLAGVTSPSFAARNYHLTRRLNLDVTTKLAEYAMRTQAHLVFASSDFVWAGDRDGLYRETDRPTGQAVYARLKIVAERAVLRCDAGAVIRYSLMYASRVALTGRPATLSSSSFGLARSSPSSTTSSGLRSPFGTPPAPRCG